MGGYLKELRVSPGHPLPLGSRHTGQGIQFSIFSRHAEGVILVLFRSDDPGGEFREVSLDPEVHRTGDIWHIHIDGLPEGQLYGYRIEGPYDPAAGHRYNPGMLLLDPHARALTGARRWDLSRAIGYDPDSDDEDGSPSHGDSAPFMPRCIAEPVTTIIAGKRPRIDERDHVIYELHVRGFTIHESSGVSHPGTFKGLVDAIPYLRELGVNAVELMPVQEFDEEENTNTNPVTGERLKNFWGYSTIAFFAPKGSYSSSGCMGEQVEEFRSMVRAFHEAGIEVILDVVFNHTAEGDETGPTLSFRGIDNSIYYMLREDRRRYMNFSGCGNTFNCNHPLVRDFILEALRYWVIEMNVDGFRFDLASILGRDQEGNIMSNPPLIEKIGEDPILRSAKIIAEAWDAAGAYQVGAFPGRWAEWNGKYRDDVRRFWRGDRESAGPFATRVSGSSDLYGTSPKGPLQSINFVTCHDGFTLNDLVSYREKRNMENGENNLDGETHNLECAFGPDGPDESTEVTRIRKRLIKNFIATLFLSQGIPMLLGGDEFRRTQKGNNNAYCQDNEVSWVDWRLREQNQDLVRFTREMIRFRKAHPLLRRGEFFTGTPHGGIEGPDLTWYGPDRGTNPWGADSHSVAMLINGRYAGLSNGRNDDDIFCIFNASWKAETFTLPDAPSGGQWRRVVDTSRESPEDISDAGGEPGPCERSFTAAPRSVVVCIAPSCQ